jgi:hypothetical protein
MFGQDRLIRCTASDRVSPASRPERVQNELTP